MRGFAGCKVFRGIKVSKVFKVVKVRMALKPYDLITLRPYLITLRPYLTSFPLPLFFLPSLHIADTDFRNEVMFRLDIYAIYETFGVGQLQVGESRVFVNEK